MRSIKRILKDFILKIIGRKRIEFMRSRPFFVHGKYRSVIQDMERYISIIEKDKLNDPELSLLLIRKYAHILDKGLHRTDVEPGHSKNIADELERHLNIAGASSEIMEDITFKWAKEKLAIYKDLQINSNVFKLEGQKEIPQINLSQFISLLHSRRSNRQFSEKCIDENILKELAQTVNWAPSSCNKQPIKLFATNNPALASQCLSQCKGGTGFSNFIPSFIAFCADMRGYYLPDELYLPAIDVSLGAQNFFLSAGLLDISVTGLSWALKDQEEENSLRELLEIPTHFQIIFNAVAGYADKEYVCPNRKNLNSTLFLK